MASWLDGLPTAAEVNAKRSGRIAKPEPRKKTRARKKRADAKGLTNFREAVWAREIAKTPELNVGMDEQWARCQRCHISVTDAAWADFWRGHVHHIVRRGIKATRYDPNNGELLCPRCHRKAHQQ